MADLIGRRLGDFERIGGDIGDHAGNALDRAGRAARMPADDLDACRDRLLDQRRLLARVDRAEDDPGRLQRDGLRQGRCAGGGLTLAVEQSEVPADSLRCLCRAVADALSAAVTLIVRHIDDKLARLCLRAGGRTGPFGHR